MHVSFRGMRFYFVLGDVPNIERSVAILEEDSDR